MKKNFLIFICFLLIIFIGSVWYIRTSSDQEEAIQAPLMVVSSPSDVTQPLPQNTSVLPQDTTDTTLPTQLSIPTIGVETSIQQVGVTTSGNMATPTNYTDVGWYKYGPRPGEMGSAVIAGHRRNAAFLPAVFYHIKDLAIGDEIFITRKDGTKLRFKVIRSEFYNYEDVPTRQLFLETGAAYLKLVTCEGEWREVDRTARERRIITAILES